MTPPVESEYRLLRAVAGGFHFARVTVTVVPGDDGVIDALDLDAGFGEMDWGVEPEWVEAALRGCREALAEAGNPACRIALRRVVGTLVDTTEEGVRFAAFMATRQALGVDAAPGRPEFVDGRWRSD